jgi:hypothetical protein
MMEQNAQLLGTWVVALDEADARKRFGEVKMEFRPGGSLCYTISGKEKDQIIMLRYWIEDHTIVTDQPSSPRTERTAFRFTEVGDLVLEFHGKPVRYVRVSESAHLS